MKQTVLFLALLVSACGGDAIGPRPIDGAWHAVSVNGSALPFSYDIGVVSTRIVARRLVLAGTTGTWHDDTEVTVRGVQYFRPPDFQISWSRSGERVTVVSTTPGWTDFSTDLDLFADGSLRNIDGDGNSVIYQRE